MKPQTKLTAAERDGMSRELEALYHRYTEFLQSPFIKDVSAFANDKVAESERVWDFLKPSEHIDEEQFKRKVFEELAYGLMYKRAYDRQYSEIRRAWEQKAARRNDIDHARGL